MRFGSVCSGIEAASMAWEPLGWRADWFAEIEPFPCAVLAHHWPDTPNLGDMTTIKDRILAGEVSAPDVFTGGTPCQAFSVAGNRKSLADERGNLSLEFTKIADAIDEIRIKRNAPPTIIVWENVPGVLSTSDNAFGCFIAELAGCDTTIVPVGNGWTNAGLVTGPKRTVAWRILDAQYFGVAQRRRRVFVVASAGDRIDPAAVLFEPEGLRRDTPPSREARKDIAGTLASRTDGGGFPGTDEACSGYIQPVGFASGDNPELMATLDVCDATKWGGNQWVNQGKAIICEPYHKVSHCLTARAMGRMDYESESFVIHGTQDPDIRHEHSHTLGRNNGQENVIAIPIHDKTTRHAGQTGKGSGNGLGIGKDGDPAPTLTAGDKHAVAIHENQRSEIRLSDVSSAITCSGGKPGQGYPAAMVEKPVGTIAAESFTGGMGGRPDAAAAGHVQITPNMAVRRLTPTECERLQGFPDGHTNVPYRGKPAPDGPRYKAIGNSWAVPVARWIGERIQQQLEQTA